jgi:hypothetical protein
VIELPPLGARVEIVGECCGQALARTVITWDGEPRRFTTPAHPGFGHQPKITATWRTAAEPPAPDDTTDHC